MHEQQLADPMHLLRMFMNCTATHTSSYDHLPLLLILPSLRPLLYIALFGLAVLLAAGPGMSVSPTWDSTTSTISNLTPARRSLKASSKIQRTSSPTAQSKSPSLTSPSWRRSLSRRVDTTLSPRTRSAKKRWRRRRGEDTPRRGPECPGGKRLSPSVLSLSRSSSPRHPFPLQRESRNFCESQ